ncbi:MAG TPA: hypothetical protein VMQ67_05885, partial [Candidatus Saccharimonadales bacterium]|nr:hypothetical protein [Candidatus Saccharimonadales bacterium]
MAGQERAQSPATRDWREGGGCSYADEYVVFEASTLCESGVAATALPPQSKISFGGIPSSNQVVGRS